MRKDKKGEKIENEKKKYGNRKGNRGKWKKGNRKCLKLN